MNNSQEKVVAGVFQIVCVYLIKLFAMKINT